jgi:plastocyanin
MTRVAGLLAVVVLLMSAASVSAGTTQTVTIVGKAFSPSLASLTVGDSVVWTNTSARKHTATSNVAFLWTAPTIRPHRSSSAIAFNNAGTFLYHCTIHARMKGTIAVAPTVSPASGVAGTEFTVTVGLGSTPGQFVHEIQVRLNGGAWQPRAASSGSTQTFVTTTTGTWEIQTRMRYLLSGAMTGWSPSVMVVVN